MPKIYTDEFLVSELHRFKRENDRVPKQSDMSIRHGYPAPGAYQSHFGSWNNALRLAGFEINRKHQTGTLNGAETCCYCGKRADEIFNFHSWVYHDDVRYCEKHGNSGTGGLPNYITGNLDKNSTIGKGTISEQIVKNVLNLEERHDCNFSEGFSHPFDLYHKKKYKCINVKDSKLHDNNSWHFTLNQKETPDTYIMLGYDEDRKNVEHVWITDAVDDLVFNEKTGKLIQSKTITNLYESLSKAEPWEVDSRPYNDMLHKMSEKRKETKGVNCFLSNDDLEGVFT